MNLSRVVFAPLIEPIRAATGASDATLGLLATLVWVGSAVPRLPTGYLLTRLTRAQVIFGSGVLLTGGTAFVALNTDPTLLLVGGFVMGTASGVYLIAANTLVSELFPSAPGRALGGHGVASQVAAVAAPTLVSAALVVGDWQTTLRAIAVAAAVTTVAFTLVARRTDFPEAGTADRDLLAAVRSQWRIVLTAVVTIGLTSMVWNGLFNFYVTYLTTIGFTEATGRTLLQVTFGAGVPAFYVSGRLSDRLPAVPYMLVILAIFAGCVLLLPTLGGFWPLAALGAVMGYAIHSIFPAVDTYLLGSLPDRHRASAYAAYGAGMMLLQAPGSVVVGGLRGMRVPFPIIFEGLGAGLVALLFVLLALHLDGRLPETAEA
ncbi:MFS transporter [Haloarcula nitratireducens]|uniref:MFS transporter n=1 Tax=Haloarcula nitratireducens TaxID=2487749 RepID=A0AAW4P6G3_9EURY|nr:MFS transporter [Halomicroarcula nitratireducens]MBX0293462.1 MFS transporter [Halomicroarcula nitratireducens]